MSLNVIASTYLVCKRRRQRLLQLGWQGACPKLLEKPAPLLGNLNCAEPFGCQGDIKYGLAVVPEADCAPRLARRGTFCLGN